MLMLYEFSLVGRTFFFLRLEQTLNISLPEPNFSEYRERNIKAHKTEFVAEKL
jgi:hypothetical protein